MKSRLQTLVTITFVAAGLSLPLRAQQGLGQQGTQMNDSSQSAQAADNGQAFDPDDRPLSGAEDLSLGTPEGAKNVLNSSIRADERLDSNPHTTSGTGYTWQGDSDVFGTVSLNRSWKRNSFTAEYDGGGIFYPGQIQSTHLFSLSQVLAWRRWSLLLSDQVIYAPESPFGIPGPQPISINYLGTTYAFTPNQTILTNQTTRIGNTSIGQVEYAFSRRASFTATASYGLLDYTANGAFNSNQRNGSLGYNYALAAHDKIAVTFGYTQIGFDLGNSKTDIQAANLSYAHQITGRWSAEFAGGAQLARVFAPGTSASDRFYPDGRAALDYAWRRTQVSLSTAKSIMSGAGLFVATDSTVAQGTLSHSFSRRLNGSTTGGFAQNSTLGSAHETYRSGFAAVNLSRSFGRHADLYLLYNFQKQIGNTFCIGPVCGESLLRHSIGAGFSWHFTPVVFR